MKKRLFAKIKVFFFILLAVGLVLSVASVTAETIPERTVGLMINENAYEGYNLFSQMDGNTVYLIDNRGKLVHSWETESASRGGKYLLENGNLLIATAVPGGIPWGNGAAGRITELDWDGNTVWQFDYSTEWYTQHHDIEKLPNGNVLLLAWDLKTYEESVEAGRDPGLLTAGGLLPEHVVEVRPDYESGYGGEIVWEWHVWDHLVQDYDPTKANFGDVAAHPELVDLNFTKNAICGTRPDWKHANSIDYNPGLDQILLSVSCFDEIWIIDHSTTTAEAAGHTGGRSGKGGDLLYRWGNPSVYRAGTKNDHQLSFMHDAKWIEPGLPGAGNILLFNNGRTGPGYSTVFEIKPPIDRNGNYVMSGDVYGPKAAVWTYEDRDNFYATIISGAQRLPNGNTLICEGTRGTIFEVTPGGARTGRNQPNRIVWEYISPILESGPMLQGDEIPPDVPPVFQATQNLTFRVERYLPDFPGFAGKDLTPGEPLELYSFSVDVDIDPKKCINKLEQNEDFQVVINGTQDLDVFTLSIPSIWLEGVTPQSWEYQDISTPSNNGCGSNSPDGITDLTLSFDSNEVISKFPGLTNGAQVQLHLTGSNLAGEFFIGSVVATVDLPD